MLVFGIVSFKVDMKIDFLENESIVGTEIWIKAKLRIMWAIFMHLFEEFVKPVGGFE